MFVKLDWREIPLKSEQINRYLEHLKQQRDTFYGESGLDFGDAWKRPQPDKWSIGETVYHLVLMVRLFRRFSTVYVPVMLPVAHMRKNKPYKVATHDIYKQYNQQKKRPMNAPFLIKPPVGLDRKWSFEQVINLLDHETDKLTSSISDVEQDVAGQIYYPDPIAEYPNLIQSMHLLAIHEQHHFDLVKRYYSHL